jgi:hypothetical protein
VALRDLTFYKKLPDGWHTVTLVELPPTPATKPATKPTTKSTASAATAPASRPTTIAATGPSTPSTSPSTTQASSQPATQPVGFPIALGATSLQEASQVLAPWKQKLTSLGLAATDQDLIVSILEKHALESNRLTAVYRLDADQLDQLMPLDVVPTPRKVVRVGLVIVRNIDPAIATEIDTLVAQLGDPKWDTREAAYKRLIELGLAARPKLELLLHNARDPEIVYRIERLIAALAPKEPGQPGNNLPTDQ